MSWEVEYAEEFGIWWEDLTANRQEHLTGAIDKLQETGPGLGRPYVDTLSNTKLANLKELRAATEGSHLRVLFAFDPRRAAILLLGGDKTGRWVGVVPEGNPPGRTAVRRTSRRTAKGRVDLNGTP